MEIYIKAISDFTNEEYKKYFEMMSDTRKSAILRLRFDGDKKRSILGEALARKAISKKCNIAEKDILFHREDYGKPFCANADIHFSISHSKEMVACAISEKKIGIDIERMRKLETRIARISCTEKDLQYVFGFNGIPKEFDDGSLLRFFRLWTAKEAYFKFQGTGIVKLKDISYIDIEKLCKTKIDNDYMITVYEESNEQKEI